MDSKLKDKNNFIKIAAFDHRDSLEKLISAENMSNFKTLLSETFKNDVTAILVDPVYGLESVKIAQKQDLGILLTREKTGYTDSPEGRITELSEFSSSDLKSMGATAIKLLLYFNPESQNASSQLEVLKAVKKEADMINLPLLVEPITYPLTSKNYIKGDSIVSTIKMIKPYTDVFKLEFPIDVNVDSLEKAQYYLELINKECSGKPWILLSRGMQFSNFIEAVALSKVFGAEGYAVGRAVWQEVSECKTWDDIKEFIKTTALNRMRELSQVYSF